MKSSLYVDASRCANSSSHPSSYFYFLDSGTPASDFNQSCTVQAKVPMAIVVNSYTIAGLSTVDIYKKLSRGFELSWEYYEYDFSCGFKISFQDILSRGNDMSGEFRESNEFGRRRYGNNTVSLVFVNNIAPCVHWTCVHWR
ncbi:hypothetical protein REPUB_Repub11eG0016100 [Reevesia pubescens]